MPNNPENDEEYHSNGNNHHDHDVITPDESDIKEQINNISNNFNNNLNLSSNSNNNLDYKCNMGTNLTYIARLIVGLRQNLKKINNSCNVPNGNLEKWAIFIHESMSIASRNYHSVQHVFDISDGSTDPILIISAFFHDVIYYHVDDNLTKYQKELLQDVFIEEKDENGSSSNCILLKSPDDKNLNMIKEIFGFSDDDLNIGGDNQNGKKKNHILTPTTGLNEFLSAVIAVRTLKDTLSFKILTEIAVCIEATIPFRKETDDGKSPMDILYDRLLKANKKFNIGFQNVDIDNSEKNECIISVQRATELANRDVGNFCSEDHTWFLDNTWSLLPETNERLRHQYLYTIEEFHFAVFKMSGFFNFFIKPEIVFVQFYNKPNNEKFLDMKIKCTRNLEIGKKYVQAKLLSSSVLLAFALLTGGDAPISLFMGDLPSRQHTSIRLADTLSMPSKDIYTKHCDVDVYNILLKGRQAEISFDIKQSPLAAYLYGYLGDEKMINILNPSSSSDNYKIYPMNKDDALKLLQNIPINIIQDIGDNICKVAVSRRKKIKNVLDNQL